MHILSEEISTRTDSNAGKLSGLTGGRNVKNMEDYFSWSAVGCGNINLSKYSTTIP